MSAADFGADIERRFTRSHNLAKYGDLVLGELAVEIERAPDISVERAIEHQAIAASLQAKVAIRQQRWRGGG